MVDLRAEIWARPGASTFAKIYADAMATRISGTLRANGIGDGQFEFPDHDDAETLADLLLAVDPTNVAAATRALIRVYTDGQTSGTDTPIHEWLVDAVVPPDDESAVWRVSGSDWLEWLNHAEVYPWDWDGTAAFQSYFPDHIWGGRNVLGDLRCSYQPEVVTLTVGADVDGGTFTISVSTDDGADTTAAIDFDATALAVYNALLALSNVDALEVDGDPGGPWTVSLTAPANQGWAVSTNNGNLEGSWELDLGGATGGTFTLTFEGQTTGSLNYNDTAATIETAVEALSNVTAATVTAGTGDTFTITFETPDSMTTASITDSTTGGAGATLTENTDTNSVVVAIQTQGAAIPAGWVSSEFSPTDILHGELQSLACWDDGGFDPALPAGATTAGVFNGRAPYFPGVEKAVRVKPGGIYQPSVYVYVRDTDTVVKLVLRDFADGPGGTNYFVEQTVTADTWTLLSITDFRPGATVEEVKFRIAHSDPDESVDPPIIYWALPKLLEGQAPTSIGGVWESLFDDATTDHSGVGRIVWEDEANPGTPWLTLDFDATNDSGGNPWDTSDVEITAKRGWPYSRVARETQNLGYELRIVPDPVTDGQWLLQMYNPGGMDAGLGSSNTVGLRVGENVYERQRKRFRPGGTTQTVEGGEQQFAFAENANAITAIGRMERYLPDRDLNGATEIATAASTLLADNIKRADSRSYRMVNPDPSNVPLVDWVPGDTIPVLDPPAVEAALRTAAVGYRQPTDGPPTFDVSMTSERLTGDAAVRGGVIQYLREVREIREEPPGGDGDLSTTARGLVAPPASSWTTGGQPSFVDTVTELHESTTTPTATLPTSSDGDRIYLALYASSDILDTPPTGFTLLDEYPTAGHYIFYLDVVGSGPSSVAFTLTSASDIVSIASTIRNPGTHFKSSWYAITGNTQNPPPVTVDAPGEHLVLAWHGVNASDAPTEPVGSTGYSLIASYLNNTSSPTQYLQAALVDIDTVEDPDSFTYPSLGAVGSTILTVAIASTAPLLAPGNHTHDEYVLVDDGGLERVSTVAASGTTETIDLADGNVHDVTLTDNCTFTFDGSTAGVACAFTLILRQDGTGSRTVTWPASVDWPSGTAPTLTTTATTGVDVITFLTVDDGTTWLGFVAGQDFS